MTDSVGLKNRRICDVLKGARVNPPKKVGVIEFLHVDDF